MAKKEVSYYKARNKEWNTELMKIVDGIDEYKCKYSRDDLPTRKVIDYFIDEWNETEKVSEDSINYLFHTCCPSNTELNQVFAKVSIINDVYSTQLSNKDKSIIAKIICDYADRLNEKYDESLVKDLDQEVQNKTKRSAYSFLTKYCSHQNEEHYPIFDSYVELMLKWYRDAEPFQNKDFHFGDEDLKERDYDKFKEVMIAFQNAFSLEDVSLKEIDMFLWIAAKKHFFPKYIDEEIYINSQK